MSDMHRALRAVHVIRCVICNREALSHEYGRDENMFTVEKAHSTQRQTEGWRLWLSRSRRWYCPDHRPKPGHGMRELVI